MSLDISFLETQEVEVFEKNITHNLHEMADEAGVGNILWYPKSNGVEIAAQMIKPLMDAIAILKAEPEKFKPFSATNGWGTYEQFVPWLEELLEGCVAHPKGRVKVSR